MTGVGGDMFAIYWSAKEKKLKGLNGSGRCPKNLSWRTFARKGATHIPNFGWPSVTVPGYKKGMAGGTCIRLMASCHGNSCSTLSTTRATARRSAKSSTAKWRTSARACRTTKRGKNFSAQRRQDSSFLRPPLQADRPRENASKRSRPAEPTRSTAARSRSGLSRGGGDATADFFRSKTSAQHTSTWSVATQGDVPRRGCLRDAAEHARHRGAAGAKYSFEPRSGPTATGLGGADSRRDRSAETGRITPNATPTSAIPP